MLSYFAFFGHCWCLLILGKFLFFCINLSLDFFCWSLACICDFIFILLFKFILMNDEFKSVAKSFLSLTSNQDQKIDFFFFWFRQNCCMLRIINAKVFFLFSIHFMRCICVFHVYNFVAFLFCCIFFFAVFLTILQSLHCTHRKKKISLSSSIKPKTQ